MGVEYRHFILAAPATWLPQADTLARVDSVLREWGLASSEPEVFDIADGRRRRMRGLPDGDSGHGVAALYEAIEGPVVPRVVGPSYYPGISEGDRYLQSIAVVVGADYRVQHSSEAVYFKVLDPARNGTKAVAAIDRLKQGLHLFGDTYPATPATIAPRVEVQIDPRHGKACRFSGFSGVWRGAVILDCGKDLPEFIERAQLLPSRDFIAAISEALRASTFEVGEVD